MTTEVAPAGDLLNDGLALSCVHDTDRVVVHAVGELDAASSTRLRRLLADLIRVRTPHIDVDLSRVTFMDSSGLGALLANRVTAEGVALAFSVLNPSQPVARVMEMTGTYDRLVAAKPA